VLIAGSDITVCFYILLLVDAATYDDATIHEVISVLLEGGRVAMMSSVTHYKQRIHPSYSSSADMKLDSTLLSLPVLLYYY